jgi:hypothetical protein
LAETLSSNIVSSSTTTTTTTTSGAIATTSMTPQEALAVRAFGLRALTSLLRRVPRVLPSDELDVCQTLLRCLAAEKSSSPLKIDCDAALRAACLAFVSNAVDADVVDNQSIVATAITVDNTNTRRQVRRRSADVTRLTPLALDKMVRTSLNQKKSLFVYI